MRAILGTLVLFGLVVLLWPSISAGLGAIAPWIIWPVVIFLCILGLSGSSNTPAKK